jgi:AcrR family transcriptional regulator
VTSQLPATADVPSRADRRRAKRIDDILRTATGLLAERGYAATSLDEIAEVLDLSKASLYHYFPSKEHLILACLDRIGDETNRQLRAVAASALSPRDRLRAAVRAQVLVLTRDQPAGAALFIRDVGLPEAARARLRTFVEQHDQLFRSIIDEGIRAGELHVADPAVARLLMHGAVNFIPSWYKQSRQMSPERLADVVAGTLLQLFGGGTA